MGEKVLKKQIILKMGAFRTAVARQTHFLKSRTRTTLPNVPSPRVDNILSGKNKTNTMSADVEERVSIKSTVLFA